MSSRLKSFFLAFSLIVVAGAPSRAAEKPLLGVDFGSLSWRELMPESSGDITITGNVACLPQKAYTKTALLPVQNGDCITATVEASCEDVVPPDGKPGYEVGSASIQLYDRTGAEYSHQDICLISGNLEWKQYQRKIMPDDRCAFISVSLSNYGKAGQVFYRNLKVSVNDEMTELIGDSGFEDVLGVNFWFFKRDGVDWDTFKCWEDSGNANLDTKIFATGRQSLRLSGGGATLVSKQFPYNGENLTISGWLRSEGIEKGNKSWCGGGVQVAGLNEKGVAIFHKDLEIMSGTIPWHFRHSEFVFPSSVKKVQVWLRLFDGAKGTVWLDEIRFLSRSDKAALPFDKAQANVSVDFSKPEQNDINYKAWAGVGGDWIWREDVQQCLPDLKAAGFEYIRMRDINNVLELYPCDNKDGSPAYNWTRFDKLFDVLVAKWHFVPILDLGHTPRALDRPGSRPPESGWTNGTAPSDMKKWGAFNEAIFEHAIQRYGKDEVGKWLWEIWNEPNVPSNSGDYIGSAEDFASLAVEIYLAKERVEAKYGARIRMGLTSGGGPSANSCIVQRLKSIGKEKLIDHVSYHNYAGAGDSINIIPSFIEDEKSFMKAISDRSDYLVGQTEWNCTSMTSVRTDTPWNATMAVKMARIYLDSKLDYSAFFHVVDHAEQKMAPGLFETRDFGLFTRPNEWPKPVTHKPIPKPVYNAFVFLNELKGGKRLPFRSSNDPVDGLAVTMPDGSLRLLLTSYDEDIARQPYVTEVAIEVKGLPKNTKYRCSRLWAADEQYGNSYGEWIKLGKTPISDVKANEQILKASKFGELAPPGLFFKDGTARLTLPLPSPGIRLVELKPE